MKTMIENFDATQLTLTKVNARADYYAATKKIDAMRKPWINPTPDVDSPIRFEYFGGYMKHVLDNVIRCIDELKRTPRINDDDSHNYEYDEIADEYDYFNELDLALRAAVDAMRRFHTADRALTLLQ